MWLQMNCDWQMLDKLFIATDLDFGAADFSLASTDLFHCAGIFLG